VFGFLVAPARGMMVACHARRKPSHRARQPRRRTTIRNGRPASERKCAGARSRPSICARDVRNLFIANATPEEAAERAAVEAHNARPPFGRNAGRWSRPRPSSANGAAASLRTSGSISSSVPPAVVGLTCGSLTKFWITSEPATGARHRWTRARTPKNRDCDGDL